MSDLIPSMPSPFARARLNGLAFGSADPSNFAVKIKIRYLVEKLVDETWVVMARLPESADRITELCEALGGTLRVQDLTTGKTLPEKDFP